MVVPTQSPPVQVSVRGSPTLRSGSEGVTPTEGGAAQWKVETGGAEIEKAKEGRKVRPGVRLVQQHLKHAVSPCSCTNIYTH